MKLFNRIISMLIVLISLGSVFFAYAAANSPPQSDALSETAILDKATDDSQKRVQQYPKDQVFGEVVIDHKHYPFINVDLAAKQGLLNHEIYDDVGEAKVKIELGSSKDKDISTFRNFINHYHEKSFINLINADGKSIGCLTMEHYQLAVSSAM